MANTLPEAEDETFGDKLGDVKTKDVVDLLGDSLA